MSKKQVDGKVNRSHKIWSVVGIIICIILIPILSMNITLIVKSHTNTGEVPSINGYLPLIVMTDSMYPEIKSGDLIICHTVEPKYIEVDDVISFFDPVGSGDSIVTHRVVDIVVEDGEYSYITKGDANNVEDSVAVSEDDLVGVYQNRIGGLGNVAMFMQTSTGLIVCVLVPLVLLVGYDLIRRKSYEKNKQNDTEMLLKELEALKAEKAARDEKEGA